MKVYANITNGLYFPHDEVCHFMSSHGHNYSMGYLRLDSMPYSAVIELLCGRQIKVVDASPSGKALTDGLRYGLTTWVLVFNRALRENDVRVAPWQTREMWLAAHRGKDADKIKRRIRRLESVYGNSGPVQIGRQILTECTPHFALDDKPELLGAAMGVRA